MVIKILLFLLSFRSLCLCDEETPRIMVKDSYLEAFKQVHTSPKVPKTVHKIMNRDSKIEGKIQNGYDQYGHPVPSYGVPTNTYAAPANNYGPPAQSYGPPAQSYGPPAPVYGPPAPVYGPPQSYQEPSNGVPYALLGILDKLHLKLDISTILKILLKLVIFKKIVSFIALICLLLFIPKFKMDKNGEEEEEDEMRSILPRDNERLNNLTQVVLAAIEDYSEKNKDCDTVFCQTQRMFKNINEQFSYQRLLEVYTTEDN